MSLRKRKKKTSNDLQSTTQKTKDSAMLIPHNCAI